MPYHFTCPYCFKQTLVDESLAGQTGPCASCGKTVTVPPAPQQTPTGLHPVGGPPVQRIPAHRNAKLWAWLLKSLGLIVGIGLMSLLVIYLLFPSFQGLKSRRDKVASLNNLQRIALALEAYAAEYGTYPPAVVHDDRGKPMHSWRVLILEHLGESGLYARYKMDEPWDSMHNSSLIANCPNVYLSPAAQDRAGLAEGNYVLITGRGTLFPPGGPLRREQIVDGPGNTLLVVETLNQTHSWTEPWDIDVTKLNTVIGGMGSDVIGGVHDEGAAAAFADGTTAFLPGDLSPVLLKGLISPAGGEPLQREDYGWGTP